MASIILLLGQNHSDCLLTLANADIIWLSSVAEFLSLSHTPLTVLTCLLLSLGSVCDLSFTFTPSLCYRTHIDNITCKALKVLGFIKRIASEFKLSNFLKTLFCALVRPIAEYGSIVFDPQTSEACKQLETCPAKVP